MIDAHAPVETFDEIDSTLLEARRRAERGDFGPVWLLARRQSAGRGRRGRAWVSIEGNLFATFLFETSRPAAEAAQLGFAAGLAIAETFEAFGALSPASLKWPNDVMLGQIQAEHKHRPPPIGGGGAREARDGGVSAGLASGGAAPSVAPLMPEWRDSSPYRGSTGAFSGRAEGPLASKAAGILLESGAASPGKLWVALAFGVNIAAAPGAIDQPTTCLRDALPEGALAPSPMAFFSGLRPCLEGWCARLDGEGFEPLRTAWLARAYGLGKRARVQQGDAALEGTLVGLSARGELEFDSAGGRRLIAAGDVIFSNAA